MAERRPLPSWAQRERGGDFAWIGENLHVFWPAAFGAYASHGRGAIVVDITSSGPGGRHPFTYADANELRGIEDPNVDRLLADYDPSWELVVVLLKTLERISAYRIGVPEARNSNASFEDVP